jgi:hypothetical protein
MPPRRATPSGRRTPRRTVKQRTRGVRFLPSKRARRRLRRAFRRAPPIVRLVVVIAILLALALAINWVYQVIRKPSELFFPVSGTLNKTPRETWREYGPIFREHATEITTPELLAALAQVEGSGNPVARTYWRWSWRLHFFDLYRPASSAVGMYQITDGTFALARRYCIHDHKVVEEGAWNDWHSCWFNGAYSRVIPSHAVELTSAYLTVSVAGLLERHGISRASPREKQELAALIHLCGAGAGEAYVRRGFRLTEGQRCGDHDARTYVGRVSAMRAVFAGLAAEDSG